MLRQESIDAHSEAKDLGVLAERLDRLPVGVIILDGERNIVYHNKLAPVREDTSGKTYVQLTRI